MSKYSLQKSQELLANMKVSVFSKLILSSFMVLNLPKLFFAMCYIISQFQILVQLLQVISLGNHEKSEGIMDLVQQLRLLVFFAQNHILKNLFIILIGISCYFILYFLATCYLLILIAKKMAISLVLQRIWGVVSYFHPLILYLPINYISLQILFADLDQERHFLNGLSIQAVQAIFILFITLNTAWALCQTILFVVTIKTKNGFSSKTFGTNLIDLFLKFIVPLVYLFDYSKTSQIILLIINLLCCLIKDWILFRTLLYYKISTLYLSAIINALLTSLAFSGFILHIFSFLVSNNNQTPVIFVWILSMPLLIKLYTQKIYSVLLEIILGPHKISNPYYLINFFEVYKVFSRYATLKIMAPRIREKSLYYHTAVSQSDMLRVLSLNKNKLDKYKTKNNMDQLFLQKSIVLLEDYIQKNPNANIVKATLARYYMKSSRNMISVENILSQNEDSTSTLQTTFHFIRFLMVQKLTFLGESSKNFEGDQKESNNLNIQNCLRNQEAYCDMKKIIQEQLELDASFWQLLQSEKSDFLSVIEQAKKIYLKSICIEKISLKYQFFKNDEMSQILLVMSLYFYLIQNDIVHGQKLLFNYCKLKSASYKTQYNQKTTFDPEDLTTETIYLIVSMSQNALGKIVNCYGPIKDIFGIDQQMMIGRSINTLMHPLYGKYHDQFLREFFHNKDLSIPHEDQELYILLKTGCIMPCKINIELNYLPGHGLCYFTLLRPIVEDNKRIVLARDNGTIISFCRNFGKDMHILSSKESTLSIYDLCPDLKEILQEDLKFQEDLEEKPSLNLFTEKSSHDFGNSKTKSHLAKLVRSQNKLESGYNVEEKNKKNIFSNHNISFCPNLGKARKGIVETEKRVFYNTKILKYMLKDISMIELQMEKIDSSETLLISQNKPKESKDQQVERIKLTNSGSLHSEDLAERIPLRKFPIQNSFRQDIKDLRVSTLEANQMNSYSYDTPKAKTIYFKKGETMTKNEHDSSDRNSENEDAERISHVLKASQNTEEFDLVKKSGIKNIEINLINKYFENDYLDENGWSKFHAEKVIEAHKMIRKVLRSKKLKRLTISYNYSFMITLACLLSFLIWLNFQVSTTSREMESYDRALQNSYFRNYWTKLANQETRIWVACNMGLFDLIDASVFVETMNKSYHMLNEYNQDLQVSLSNLDLEIQEAFYKKEVKVFDRKNDQTLELISIDNTFQLIGKIINNGIKNVKKPLPEIKIESLDPETQFIFDNSFNELLVVSESLTLMIKQNVLKILSEAETIFLGALLVTSFVIILFVLFSLYFVVITNKDSENLMEILFTIPLREINKTEHLISKFNETLSKDYSEINFLAALGLYHKKEDLKIDNSDKNVKESNTKSYRKQIGHKSSMRKVFTRNYLIFSGIIALFGLQVGFMFIYYNQAMDKILLMKRHHTSMDTALDYLNSIALSSVEAQAVVIDNATSTIRGVPIFESSRENIIRFKKIAELQVNLQKDETISPYEQEVFMNISCQNIYSPLYSLPEDLAISECIDLSNGLGRVGLINMLSRLPVELNQMLSDFEFSSRDKAAMTTSYNAYFSPSFLLIDTSSALILLLFVYTTNDFEVLVTQLEEQRIILAWLALVVSVISGSVIWVFLVKSLLYREFENKLAIKVVPNKIIMRNWRLKKLLETMIN